MELDIFNHKETKKYSTKIINTWGGDLEISLDENQYKQCKEDPFKIREIIIEHLIYLLHSFSINATKNIDNNREYCEHIINCLKLNQTP